MRTIIRPCLTIFSLMALLTGIIYPLAITAGAQWLFPVEANGSLINRLGKATTNTAKAVGSRLIGQNFTSPRYFWPRPSATNPPYNADASTGSNYGPRSPALQTEVKTAVRHLQRADRGNLHPIPVDLVTSSASGLDPDISPAAAYYQASRVAAARHMPVAPVKKLIAESIREPWLGFFGECYINVLELNIHLDQLSAKWNIKRKLHHHAGRSTP